MLCELVSKLAPNCGDVSSTTFDIAPEEARPDTTALLVIFLRPPPDVSTAKKTSSLATVDISDKSPTATGLKLVPSATSICPEVFVPITKSSPDIVRSPPTTTSPLNVALPARAISMSKAVIAEEPSVPLILKFLSAVLTVSSTSVELFAMSNIDVPSSFIVTFAPPASNTISPEESSVMSVPSFVIVSSAMLPMLVILASLMSKVPVTSKLPPTETLPVVVRLSLMVTSEVVCPIEIGTPDVAVPIVIPFEVLELSIFNDVVASNEIVVPSTASVPSISVLSKLAVPSTSISPARSIPAAPARTKSSVEVSHNI